MTVAVNTDTIYKLSKASQKA